MVTSESDGTQSADVLAQLVEAIDAGAEIAVATPLVSGPSAGFRGVPLHRRVLSHGANLLYRVLLPMRGLSDYTNLQRAFAASTLLQARASWGASLFDRTGFEAVPDLLLKLRAQRPRVVQVGIEIRADRQERASSMRVLRTILASLRLCAGHRLGRIRP